MSKIIIPANYKPALNLYDTQRAIGTVKRITDSAYATSGTVTTLTVASGATACEGDEFEIYPSFGFKKAALDSGKQKIVLDEPPARS